MENLSSSYGVRSRWLRDDDPVYPCNWVATEAKRRCYQMVTSRILPSVGDDWTRTAEMCTSVESAFVHMCFKSFGRDASSRSNRDAADTIETCAIARPYGGEDDCIWAAAQDVVSNFTSGEQRAARSARRSRASLAEPCFEGHRLRRWAASGRRLRSARSGLSRADVERRARRGVHARRAQRATAHVGGCRREQRR